MNIKCTRPAQLALVLLALAAPLLAANVVRAGSTQEPQHMDPARVWDDTSSFYVHNIFDTLVRLDPQTMKIEPSLAVSLGDQQGRPDLDVPAAPRRALSRRHAL